MAKIYQTLESEKYLLATLKDDQNIARAVAREKASKAIVNTIFVLLSGVAGFMAWQTMPTWLPPIQECVSRLVN